MCQRRRRLRETPMQVVPQYRQSLVHLINRKQTQWKSLHSGQMLHKVTKPFPANVHVRIVPRKNRLIIKFASSTKWFERKCAATVLAEVHTTVIPCKFWGSKDECRLEFVHMCRFGRTYPVFFHMLVCRSVVQLSLHLRRLHFAS